MSFDNTTTTTTTTSIATTTEVSNTVLILSLLLKNFVQHLPIVFIVFGSIGFVGNALTYLHPDLRSNTCCIYSFCSSIVDIIFLLFDFLPIYLSGMFRLYVPWIRLPNLCKFFYYTLAFFPHLSINFLLMAIIDRFACTCQSTSFIGRLHRLKMVPLLILITIIISCLFSLRAITLYDYVNNVGCIPIQPLINSILYISFNGIGHPLTMLIFVLLTYRNVRNSRRRVGGTTTNFRQSRRQFMTMIFAQVLVTAFVSLQWMTMYAYYYISSEDTRTPEQQAIINLVYRLSNSCFYLNNAKSFYISIITSQLFRQTFRKTLISILPRHFRQRWHVSEADMSIMTITRQNRQLTKSHLNTIIH